MSGPATFAIPPTFLGIPRTNRDAALCIAGVPLDIGTTNRSGARFGPAAVRQASRMLVDGFHPTHWVDPAAAAADIGDFSIALGDIPSSLKLIEEQATGLSHLIAIGGEHGITLPILRALRNAIGRPVALIHFDAHVDTWSENFGQVYAHGSVFYHAIVEELIDPKATIQIGIRSPVDKAVYDWTLEKGVTVITAQEVHEAGCANVANRIQRVIEKNPCYLTFDVDALDPAFAPGTGTPEIGGLASWQAQSIIRRLGNIGFIGMDLVEVAPAYDVAEITALAGATMVWEYLALVSKKRSVA